MKFLLVGYGAMGQCIEKIAAKKGHQVIIKGENPGNLNLDLVDDYDVLIDFSHSDNLKKILDFSVKRKKPIVIGTTGHNIEQLDSIKEYSQDVAILHSSNMSLGIAIVKKVIKDINRLLSYNSDIEIIEKHHNNKLDAPSGTALMLADALKQDKDYQIIAREHIKGKRSNNQIAIHAIRGGGIIGEHSVGFYNQQEVIEVTHQAINRDLFGDGAINAAEFIKNKKTGLYTIDDVVNSNN